MSINLLTVTTISFLCAIAIAARAPNSSCKNKIYVGTPDEGLTIFDSNNSPTLHGRKRRGGGGYPRLPNIYSIFAEGNNVYVGSGNGFRLSRDGGKTWKTINLNPSQNGQPVYSVFASKNSVYAGTYDYSGFDGGRTYSGGRFLASNNKGETWSVNVTASARVTSVYANNNQIYFGTEGKGLAISENGGKTWRYVGKAQGFPSDNVVAIAGVGNKVYVGFHDSFGTVSGGVISISEDAGRTWRTQKTSPSAWNGVNSIAVAQNKIYVASAPGGLSISSDGGKTWVNKGQNEGLPNDNAMSVAVVGNNIYVGTYRGGLSISRDGGNTWTATTDGNGVPIYDVSTVFVQCI